MLTARDAVEDRVAGLDGGADDYLTKPFSFAELLGAAAGARAARPDRAAGGARGRRPAARPGHAAGLARRARRSSSRPRSSRCSRRSCAAPARCLSRLAAARARVGLRLREPLQRGRRLRALPAREDRPALRRDEHRDGARRGLPAARGRGHPEPAARAHPAHARLHGRDGRGPDRGGPVRLRASGLGPRGGARQLAALASGRSRGTGGWWAARLVGPGSPRGERREPRSADRTRRQGRLLERWAGRRPGPHEGRARARQAGPALREPRLRGRVRRAHAPARQAHGQRSDRGWRHPRGPRRGTVGAGNGPTHRRADRPAARRAGRLRAGQRRPAARGRDA